MDNRIEKIKTMQTSLLIDVVKNYKQHGYSIEIRNEPIKTLEDRGVHFEDLKLTGNTKNKVYENAMDEYRKYNVFSVIALVLNIISIFLLKNPTIISFGFYIFTLIFILLSFSSARKLSIILDDKTIDFSFVYILIGIFLYFIIFFITRRQIKDRISLIR